MNVPTQNPSQPPQQDILNHLEPLIEHLRKLSIIVEDYHVTSDLFGKIQQLVEMYQNLHNLPQDNSVLLPFHLLQFFFFLANCLFLFCAGGCFSVCWPNCKFFDCYTIFLCVEVVTVFVGCGTVFSLFHSLSQRSTKNHVPERTRWDGWREEGGSWE